MERGMALQSTARLFRALAAETRLGILRSLAERTLCVGAIANSLGVSDGAVSQHLKVLKEAGLVRGERRGYYMHYEVAADALERVAAAAAEVLSGAPEPCDPSACKEDGSECAGRKRSANTRKD
jgi:ArsR family transcriptional regulator